MRMIRVRSVLAVVGCVMLLVGPLPGTARAVDRSYSVSFPPHEARWVRVLVKATNHGEPCIDELEVFGPDDDRNLAQASDGVIASASSCLAGHAIHQVAHLNDGRYGNAHSWIAAGRQAEWAQIEFSQPKTVARVVLSRDREGQFLDRVPTKVDILVSMDGQTWQLVAQMKNRAPVIAGMPPYEPPAELPQPVTWDGLLRYAFLCEKATWEKLDTTDHLSPHQSDRPALPAGPPYWKRIAELSAVERNLMLLEQLLARIAAKGVDVSAERQQLAALRKNSTLDETSRYLAIRLAKRRLMFRDPDLAALQRILFVQRHPYLSSHNYSDVLDSQFQPGGGICVLEIPLVDGRLAPEDAQRRTLFDAAGGIARDPMADFGGRRVFFAYRAESESGEATDAYWHLMSVNADGSQLRQLTDGPFHDYYPCPLPDGGLAFISTRCRARFLCWRPQAFVLFRMDGDDIRPLSYANLSEWTPAVMRDGRLLWTRSEYIDKGADFGHTLWAIRPNGEHPQLIFGNNTPNCYINGREVPGTREILCTLFSHGGDHNGPLGLINLDAARGPADSAAITNITPDTRPHYNMSWPRYECWRDPVPVTRDYYLASHAPADRWGLYVVDRWGNRELLYLDPEIGSMTPSPLRAVTPPPVLEQASSATGDRQPGRMTLANVYEGLGAKVPPGAVKYLRVCQEVRAELRQMPDGTFQADHTPFQDWYATPVHKVSGPNGWPTYVAKASLGLVPVEADGSASFEVPAGKVLYFQALDKDLNELQRMRSVVQLQPGEQRSCIGCHEHRHAAPPIQPRLAARRAPHQIEPPSWGDGPFAYERVVQPVWDQHCVRCHDDADPQGLSLTGSLDDDLVPASYRSLIEGGWVHYFDMTYQLRHHKAEPKSFGTLNSKLWKLLDAGHYDVKLSRAEMRAVKCWIDLNCPLWPDYQFRPDRHRGIASLSNDPLRRPDSRDERGPANQ